MSLRTFPPAAAILSAALLGAVAVPAVARDAAEPHNAAPDISGTPAAKGFLAANTILQNASNASHLTTFVAAIRAAGLADTLQMNGPLTVFAPTNAAFGRLPAGTVDKLMTQNSHGLLAQILTYHIVAGRLETKDLTDGRKLTTIQGDELTVRCGAGKIMIVDANDQVSTIAVPDLDQSNGVIHMVDRVMVPRVWAQLLPRN